MSGKFRPLQLASSHFVGKVCKSFRYLPELAVGTRHKLQALVAIERQSYCVKLGAQMEII